MQGRKFQNLRPTERLIIIVLRVSAITMTLAELSQYTGSSAATLADSTQRLVKQGLLLRRRIGALSYFKLPEVELARQVAE
jgi:hypothetical protein